MAKNTGKKIKLMVYMPPKLYKRLGYAMVRADQGDRSKFICAAVEKALDGGSINEETAK